MGHCSLRPPSPWSDWSVHSMRKSLGSVVFDFRELEAWWANSVHDGRFGEQDLGFGSLGRRGLVFWRLERGFGEKESKISGQCFGCNVSLKGCNTCNRMESAFPGPIQSCILQMTRPRQKPRRVLVSSGGSERPSLLYPSNAKLQKHVDSSLCVGQPVVSSSIPTPLIEGFPERPF